MVLLATAACAVFLPIVGNSRYERQLWVMLLSIAGTLSLCVSCYHNSLPPERPIKPVYRHRQITP